MAVATIWPWILITAALPYAASVNMSGASSKRVRVKNREALQSAFADVLDHAGPRHEADLDLTRNEIAPTSDRPAVFDDTDVSNGLLGKGEWKHNLSASVSCFNLRLVRRS